jgi:hypothetical protein
MMMMMMMMMMGFLEAFLFFWQTLKKKLTLLFGCVYEFEKKKGGFFLFLSAILDVSCWSP